MLILLSLEEVFGSNSINMQFSKILIASLAFTLANAVAITNSGFAGITVGEPFTITWTGAQTTVTLKLRTNNNMQTVETIGCR
jgi:hypothetical protein